MCKKTPHVLAGLTVDLCLYSGTGECVIVKRFGLLQNMRLLRHYAPPKKIDGFCSGRIEIAAVAALLRNDISCLFSFLCILRIRSGARNDKRFIFTSLRAWPQGADSKNRAAISGLTMVLFQNAHQFRMTGFNYLSPS